MELRRNLAILLQRWLPITLAVIAGAAAGFANTDRTEVYSAQSSIYIGASEFSVDGSGSDISGDRSAGLDRLLSTYSLMIDSDPVASDALALTDLPLNAQQAVARTSVFPAPGTNLLLVEAESADPVEAQRLSVAMSEAFILNLDALEPGAQVGEGDLPSIAATIFDRAKLPTRPQPNNVLSNIIVGAVLGLCLSAGTVLLVEYLDVTIKNGDDASERLGLDVLGAIPWNNSTASLRGSSRRTDVSSASVHA